MRAVQKAKAAGNDETVTAASTAAFNAVAPSILSTGTALPPNVIDQEILASRLRELWSARGSESRQWRSLFEQIFRSVRVKQRHLALPLSAYVSLDTFSKTNDAWLQIAPELGAAAADQALTRAGLSAQDIDHLFFISSTGVATPSVDARMVNRLGMRRDIRRTPIFGLGCAGGVAGIARTADVLRSLTNDVALVVAVELCSLTLQRTDISAANVIASALFGDGAAAVVLGGANVGGDHCMPHVLATRSVFYPHTEEMMGWDVVDSGFKIVLSRAIPDLAREHLGRDVDAFLTTYGLTRQAISHWIAHPGGNRVLEAIAAALSLPAETLDRSWRLLASTGNLSSASALFVLNDLIEEGTANAGEFGMMLALGPGFCAELALLQWRSLEAGRQ